MPKASPQQIIFEGELSPLAQQRTDMERYGRGMRYMRNGVASRTGPYIGRSGTYFEQRAAFADKTSALRAFVFNEDETLVMEFAHQRLRFHYEYSGVAANREIDAVSIVTTAPLKIKFTGHDWNVGEYVVLSDFAGVRNVNNAIGLITALSGSGNEDVTFGNGDIVMAGATGALSSTEFGAVVYEVATPYDAADVRNIRVVQFLNTLYLFCAKTAGGAYKPQVLKRYDTFDWRLSEFVTKDGPFLDINTTTTILKPTGKGTWMPDMTSNSAPSGLASATSEATNHPAWHAFDNDIDTYWESKTAQEATLEYRFDNNFVDLLPLFSSGTSGTTTITASSVDGSNAAWKVGDKDGGTDWRSGTGMPQQILVDFGAAPQIVREYKLRASKKNEEYAPVDWTLQCSPDNASWGVADTRTGVSWDSGEDKHFTVGNPIGVYRYWRIVVTKVQRKTVTTKIPASGKKGKKNYVKAKTVTTKTDNRAALATLRMSGPAGVPRVADGYTIYLGRYAKGKEVKAHAPKTWYFEGYDGVNWELLDSQQDYTEWGNYRSEYFPLQNREAYLRYRLRVKEVKDNGDVTVRIGKLVLSSPDAPALALVASSKVGINDDQGFLSTDVGRQIRLKDADNKWRWTTIVSVTDAVTIGVSVKSADPLVLEKEVHFWRLGLWSDTTGYPTCGTIFEDRLWCSGAEGFPDHVAGSRNGRFTNFQQTNPSEVVLDDHAIVTRIGGKEMSRVVWIRASQEALMLGTGREEFILTTPVDEALTARNAKIRPTTNRGSVEHEPVNVANHVLMVGKSGRSLWDYSWQAGSDTEPAAYSNVLASVLGPHLLYPPLEQIVFQEEPHSVVWGRRTDGSVVAMTYNMENNVYGGHRHDFAGGVVEDMVVVPSPTDRQDSLWLVIKRTINGQTVRYIERLARFWDFGDDLQEDGCFVDSAIRYMGNTAITVAYGLRHLEGEMVHVLADNIVYRNKGPVTNGLLTLDNAATWVIVGKQMTREGEVIAPDAGAADGTARGKSKRPHTAVLALWESANGEVGRYNEDQKVVEYAPIEYRTPTNPAVPAITLRTEETGATVLPPGYGTLGTVRFRQTDPLPLNVTGVYPQLVTSDDR